MLLRRTFQKVILLKYQKQLVILTNECNQIQRFNFVLLSTWIQLLMILTFPTLFYSLAPKDQKDKVRLTLFLFCFCHCREKFISKIRKCM